MPTSTLQTRCLIVALSLGSASWARAQDKPAVPAQPAAAPSARDLRLATQDDLTLDCARLLVGCKDDVLKDVVWKAQAPSGVDSRGKKLPDLSVVVVPMDVWGRAFRVSSPPINPAAGRFIAWYIPRPEEVGFEEKKAEAGKGGGKPGAKAVVPPGAPRFASGFSVTADGQISWEVDRFTSTMKVVGGGSLTDEKTFYLFAMDRKALKALTPPPYKAEPPYKASVRGKDEKAVEYRLKEEKAREDYAKRVAAGKKDHADKVALYQSVVDKVGNLPDRFLAPCPPVVYAVYYAPAKLRENERAYGGYKQGNWIATDAQWNAYAALAAGTGMAPVGPMRDAAEEKLKLLESQIKGGHPAALQAMAVTLAKSGLLNDLTLDGLPFRMADGVIAGADAEARRIAVKGLVEANISSGKAELLRRAVTATANAGEEVAGSDLSVASLRVLLRAKETDTDAKRVEAVVRAMGDARGPAPHAALAELMELVEGSKGGSNNMLTAGRARALAKAFNVFGIADKVRRKAALTAVAAASAKSPLAAVLLDESMLGVSSGEHLVEALDAIAALPEAPAVVGQIRAPKPVKVPLFSEKNNLLVLLGHADEGVRLAAWKALPRAQVLSVAFGKEVDNQDDQKGADTAVILARVTDAGLAGKDTPPELAVFLEAHTSADEACPHAMTGLMRMLAMGDGAAARKAMTVLSRPELVSNFVVTAAPMELEMRWKVVTRCYETKGLPAPDVAGLLMAPNQSNAILTWFGTQFVKGQLPMAARFADQVKDDAALLDMVLAQDSRLAKGAVAMLAYHQGADDAQAAATVTQMLGKPYKLRAQMEREWESCKNNLFMGRVKSTEGERLVRLAAIQKGEKKWHDADMGPVVLQWKGGEDGLALGVPGLFLLPDPDKKALVLQEAVLLDRINAKTRRALDLTSLAGAVSFVWNPPCWEAQVQLPDDRVALIQIAPTGWKTLPEPPVLEVKPAK